MYDLTIEAINELKNILEKINNFKGKWINIENSDMFYADTHEYAYEAMSFLYKYKLIINFDWMSWKEGSEFFESDKPNKYDNLDRKLILKLLSAMARNDRFCTGAWGSIFIRGEAQILFKKLLETYEE